VTPVKRLLVGERGHKRPGLSALVVVLGMLVATAMLGVLYLAGSGQLPVNVRQSMGPLPTAPDDWPEFRNDYFQIKHPPDYGVREMKSPTAVADSLPVDDQFQSHVRSFTDSTIHEPFGVFRGDWPVVLISIHERPETLVRQSVYSQLREEWTKDNSTRRRTRITQINGIPSLVYEETPPEDMEDFTVRTIGLVMITYDSIYHLESSIDSNSKSAPRKSSRTIKQIITSLEPRSNHE
jgi:hypothetical protein